jgi:hypothetical protein
MEEVELELIVDDPSAIEDAREGGFGLLHRVENASDLAQPRKSVEFQGVPGMRSHKGQISSHEIGRDDRKVTYLQNNKSLHHL